MTDDAEPEGELGQGRVVAAGEDLQIPGQDYRLVAGSELDVNDRPALEQLATLHGAVLFKVCEGEDWWAFAVLINVDLPWMVLELGEQRLGVATSGRNTASTGPGHFIALVKRGQCWTSAAWDHALPLEAPQFLLAHRDELGLRIWETANWRLAPDHGFVHAPLRDWNWLPGEQWGPIVLTIFVDATADALVAWLASRAPLPYSLESPGRYRDQSGHERGALLVLGAGSLRFVRSYPTPPDETYACDAALLSALIAGELGPLVWELVDEDYGYFMTGGPDAPSLADYLSQAADKPTIMARRDELERARRR